MALKMLLAMVTVAAVGVGLILPTPHVGRATVHAHASQIAQIDVAR